MTPVIEDEWSRVYCGDVLAGLKEMADESVQCCVTSPPYWGLRDYGVEGQIGLEATPEEYVAKMTAVFREVRRVLKKDGTCWVNMGDCYVSTAPGSMGAPLTQQGILAAVRDGTAQARKRRRPELSGDLKPKDLVGMPWMVAFALRADGWWLRMDIIWHKPNPMPESVCDRPTKAHEYLFLLTKSQRYFYDQEAILEPVTGNAHARWDGVNPKARIPAGWDTGSGGHDNLEGRYSPPSHNGSDFRNGKKAVVHENIGQEDRRPRLKQDEVRKRQYTGFNERYKTKQNESFSGAVNELVEQRNKRSVWTIPTYAFPEAHFATFPPDLVKPCVLAGSRAGDVVLDPFGGSGTVGEVAIGLGRKCWLIELNPKYVELMRGRMNVTPGLGV